MNNRTTSYPPHHPIHERSSEKARLIEVRIQNWRQLFDTMDPSPFIEKDMDSDAEQYIVGSANELPARSPLMLVIHLGDTQATPAEDRQIGEAIREHFVRQSGFARKRLRQLLRRGWISLAIGSAFLTAALMLAAALIQRAGASSIAVVASEGLLICGWVAMWRPIEIFLFDWWPIFGERRTFDRLSRMPVKIVHSSTV